MDELTKYIFHNYPNLMNAREAAAYKSVIGGRKAESSHDSPKMQELIRRRWISSDPEVRTLLEKGEEQFMISVRERILRENKDEVFLNYCSRCGSLANTPRAKQCPRCFFSWHDNAE